MALALKITCLEFVAYYLPLTIVFYFQNGELEAVAAAGHMVVIVSSAVSTRKREMFCAQYKSIHIVVMQNPV